ncbi:Tetratrico peptide repeat-containing protein [Microbulbifer donghaiensis]|uniref:Tetratrico peptide repeat-containing protein n=1 Tax=Microbulbifer donghaiensis TaxID=494016 RepID=A0A1M5CQE1_9GAMM|nr:sulfotransferase [Microbulbifer donghaiensis]SHF56975.1 Tetratrico peptide repeat-containing protein [Microbulbifer donghaiensis]
MIDRSNFVDTLRRARSAYAASHFSEAEQLYLTLLNSGLEREKVLTEVCQLYLRSGQTIKAVQILKDLVRLNPTCVDYVIKLASVCISAGLPEEGVSAYQQALSLNPDLPNCLYNLALQLRKLGRLVESAKAYEEAISRGISGQDEVFNNLALVYSELNEPQRAEECFERALTINPNYTPALFNRAGLEEERGHKEKAESLYRHVLAQQNDYYPALCRLAYLGDVTSRDDPIIRQLKSALQHSSVPPLEREELWFALGKVLDDCASYEEAFQAYYSANNIGRARFIEYRKDLQEKFITELMETFSSNWFSSAHSENTDFTPIFICGMLRSGSTLLEKFLGRHSRITAGGELEYFPQLVRQIGGGYPRSLRKMEVEYFQNAAREYRRFLRERLGSPEYLTDKRPDNFLHVGLIKSLFPAAKIIWTRRELLDNCLSIYFQQLGDAMNYSVDLDSIGHYYQQHVRLMEYWKSLFPSSIEEVNYESFVSSPRGNLERLLEFIGLEWEDSCLDFTGGEGSVKTASIWQVRKPLYKKSSGRHKNYEKYLEPLQKYL